MKYRVCLGSYSLRTPKAGGYAWMFINWALGLKANNVEVVWLDSMLPHLSAEEKKNAILTFKKQLAHFGIEELVVIHSDATTIDIDLPECAYEDSFFESIDLFINLGYDLPEFFISRFKKKIFVDLDPGQTQVWQSLGHLYIPGHDFYYTYGENVSRSCLIPSNGLDWIHTPPPVSSELWMTSDKTKQVNGFTTVTNWWGEWFTYGDELFDNSKRISFLAYKELPQFVEATLEIAAFFKTGHDETEMKMLQDWGWRIRHVLEISDTPFSFQNYVMSSLGEFSCMLPAYKRLETAWTSERSLNYLAAGKPVIITDTGKSSFLPENEGILRFTNQKEAIRCIENVLGNYDFHAKRAREIICEYFEAGPVLKKILEKVL